MLTLSVGVRVRYQGRDGVIVAVGESGVRRVGGFSVPRQASVEFLWMDDHGVAHTARIDREHWDAMEPAA
jgi:hypothetical protein